MSESSDLRQFIREITTRHERVLRDLIAEMRGLRVDVDDLREESRAQTRALLHVLDRLENGGAQA